MMINEAKFPGIQVNGSIDLSCQHNQQFFQKSLKILRLILEFRDKKREIFWLWSVETLLLVLTMAMQDHSSN